MIARKNSQIIGRLQIWSFWVLLRFFRADRTAHVLWISARQALLLVHQPLKMNINKIKTKKFCNNTYSLIKRRVGWSKRFVFALEVLQAVFVLKNDSCLVFHCVRLGVQLLDQFLLALKCIFLPVLDFVCDLVSVRSPSKIIQFWIRLSILEISTLTSPPSPPNPRVWHFWSSFPSPSTSFWREHGWLSPSTWRPPHSAPELASPASKSCISARRSSESTSGIPHAVDFSRRKPSSGVSRTPAFFSPAPPLPSIVPATCS